MTRGDARYLLDALIGIPFDERLSRQEPHPALQPRRTAPAASRFSDVPCQSRRHRRPQLRAKYRRVDPNARDTHRASGNDREIVYGVEPIRELVAAAPASIRVLYVKSGDERRFAAEIDLVRTGGGRVEFADEAGLERLADRPRGIRGSPPSCASMSTHRSSRFLPRSPTPSCWSMASPIRATWAR